jgi:acetyl-CoA carboxylase biotin carboxyl carrier protein
MKLSHEDVREILRIIDESPVDELRIETEGFSLHVRRDPAARAQQAPGLPPGALVQPAGAQSAPGLPPAAPRAPAPPPPLGPPAATPGGAPAANGSVTIESPMLGTFYRAEGPGQEPFVEVGDQVSPDTTVCIIEVMKMMNSVPAGMTGTIVEICQPNAELVEYGAPLFRVEPAP